MNPKSCCAWSCPILIATLASIMGGTLVVCCVLAAMSMARPSWDLILGVMLVAGIFVGLSVAVVFVPLQLLGFFRIEQPGFIWKTSLAGGLGYLMVNVLADVVNGGGEMTLQYFSSFVFLYSFGIGGLYASVFAVALRAQAGRKHVGIK